MHPSSFIKIWNNRSFIFLLKLCLGNSRSSEGILFHILAPSREKDLDCWFSLEYLMRRVVDETTKTTEDSDECRETALTLTPKRSVFVSFLLQVTTTGHCDNNTVVFLVTWPWIGSEAGDDLVLIQTSLLFL